MDTYEKKYKEALGWMQSLYNGLHGKTKEEAERYFPELKDEDEKIRKDIINYLNVANQIIPQFQKDKWIAWLEKQGDSPIKWYKNTKDYKPQKYHSVLMKTTHGIAEGEWNGEHWIQYRWSCIIKDSDVIAWMVLSSLEKQSEQKSTDKVEPKFKIGDWVIDKQGIVHQIANVIENVTNHTYAYDIVSGGYFNDNTEGVRLWTIQDAKDGDVLFLDLMCGKTFIYNGINSDMAILYSFIVSNDGEDVLPYHIGKPNTGIGYIEENKNIIHPATQKQRDLLFQKMHEAGYEWDAEKKELRRIEHDAQLTEFEDAIKDMMNDYRDAIGDNDATIEEIKKHSTYLLSLIHQKPAWSEEDEEMFDAIIADIQFTQKAHTHDDNQAVYEREIDWLKSLKERI